MGWVLVGGRRGLSLECRPGRGGVEDRWMNQYTCIGRLGADPRLRGQDGPTPVCRFLLAVSQLKRDNDKDAAPLWFTVTVFGRQALACARFLKQGKQVAVTGRLEPDQWTGQDGVVHHHVQVIAHNVEFL